MATNPSLRSFSHRSHATLLSCVFITASLLTASVLRGNEFTGPFPSWANIKTAYGAKGDGVADDTTAFARAFADLGTTVQTRKVLYIPAGTYKITSRVAMRSRISVSVIGESAETTKIVWAGNPAPGKPEDCMFLLDGVAYSRVNRLSFEGPSGMIGIRQSWSGGNYFDSGNEYADNVFRGLGWGILGGDFGQGAAETSVLRCRFYNISQAAVSVNNWNALDWWVRDCFFQNCKYGVTNRGRYDTHNDDGSGNFNVYSSTFVGSTAADIYVGNTGIFNVRWNTSVNSKVFFHTLSGWTNGGPITIQGNRIVDTIDRHSINVQNQGPLTLVDNIIRSRSSVSSQAVRHDGGGWPADTLAVGNTFTCNQPIVAVGRFTEVDTTVVAPSAIDGSQPAPVAFEAKVTRPVIEVPAGANGAALQNAINQAAALNGQRPVVHLSGDYTIMQTLSVPANTDLQLMGDGFGTVIIWGGPEGSMPMIRISGPTKVTLRDFQVKSFAKANGIVIENIDHAGARIFMQQVITGFCREHGLLVDHVEHALIEGHDFQHQQHTGNGVTVRGGGGGGGRVNLFAGASSNNGLSYEVSEGAKLLVEDFWYETPDTSLTRFLRVSGNGTFTQQGGRVALASGSTPAFDITNFQGTAAILSLQSDDRIAVSGNGFGGKVLVAGLQHDNTALFSNSSSAQTAAVHNRYYSGGSWPIDTIGTSDHTFVRNALAHSRAQKPSRISSAPTNFTDARLHRVRAQDHRIGILIKGGYSGVQPPAAVAPTAVPSATPAPSTPSPTPVVGPAVAPTSSPVSSPSVTTLSLINADNGQPIAGFDPIANGAIINLAALPAQNLNVRANTAPAVVGSVVFDFDGSASFRTENNAPYAFAGDADGFYYAWTPSTGAHVITATPYTESSSGGTPGKPCTVRFTVVSNSIPAPTPAPKTTPHSSADTSAGAVVSFTLINADTDQPVAGYEVIHNGAVIDLARIPTANLNIRANVGSTAVGSVHFRFDGKSTRLENTAPFALAGDLQGNYYRWTPVRGTHSLIATPYTGASGGGAAGTPCSISFSVIKQ
jgi:Pectate lyase superfamily protein